MPTHSLSY